jgi:hypothetical protein
VLGVVFDYFFNDSYLETVAFTSSKYTLSSFLCILSILSLISFYRFFLTNKVLSRNSPLYKLMIELVTRFLGKSASLYTAFSSA